MIVACYYTNDGYRALAERMMASAERVGLDAVGYFKENPSGSWQSGDAMKTSVVLEAMNDYPLDSILFVDADCRFLSYPHLIDDKSHDADMAVYFDRPGVPFSTVTWFRAKTGRRYVEKWLEMMKKFPDKPNDVVGLARALDEIRPRRVFHMPASYSWTETWMRKRFGGTVPVIEHFAVGEHSFKGNEYPRSDDTLYKS